MLCFVIVNHLNAEKIFEINFSVQSKSNKFSACLHLNSIRMHIKHILNIIFMFFFNQCLICDPKITKIHETISNYVFYKFIKFSKAQNQINGYGAYYA
jgi:hypothetical protein